MERLDRRGEHIRPAGILPRDVVAIRVRQMTDEFTLRPAVFPWLCT